MQQSKKDKFSLIEFCISRKKLVLVIIISCLAITLPLTFLVWYNSDSDMRRAEAYAKDNGISIRYENILLEINNPHGFKSLKRIEEILDNRIWEFSGSDFYDKLPDADKVPCYSGEYQIYPGDKINENLIKYYNELLKDPMFDELLDLVEELGMHPPILTVNQHNEQDIFYITYYNHLAIMLSEYTVSAETDVEFNRRLRLLIKFTKSIPEGWIINALVHTAIVGLITDVARTRIKAMDKETTQEFIELKLFYMKYVIKSFKHELVYLFKVADGLNKDRLESYNYSGKKTGFLLSIYLKYFREECLNEFIELVIASNVSLDAVELKVEEWRKKEMSGNFLEQSGLTLMPAMTGMVKSIKKTDIDLALLIAVKNNLKIPNDIHGHPFVAIIKDGKMIGMYSVGDDGIDDGWDNEFDSPIWFYDHLPDP